MIIISLVEFSLLYWWKNKICLWQTDISQTVCTGSSALGAYKLIPTSVLLLLPEILIYKIVFCWLFHMINISMNNKNTRRCQWWSVSLFLHLQELGKAIIKVKVTVQSGVSKKWLQWLPCACNQSNTSLDKKNCLILEQHALYYNNNTDNNNTNSVIGIATT